MSSPREASAATRPWSLARRFSDDLSGVFGSVLCDVMVVGSATLGDWQADSDVDLVCVVARTPDPAELDTISRLHNRSRHEYGHTIDAMYVTPECLSLGPALSTRWWSPSPVSCTASRRTGS